MNARVPTLPTPTTLRAHVARARNRSSELAPVIRQAWPGSRRNCSCGSRGSGRGGHCRSGGGQVAARHDERAAASTIRYCPSTTSPSLDSAWQAVAGAGLLGGLLGSLRRFPARSCSAFFPCAVLRRLGRSRIEFRISSSARCAYQMSIVRMLRELGHRARGTAGTDARVAASAIGLVEAVVAAPRW